MDPKEITKAPTTEEEITRKIESRLGMMEEMIGEMIEAGRMRSDFALKHFVIGQHDTPGKQRAQALMELQGLYFSMADVYDDLLLDKISLEELESESEADKINKRKLERGILSKEIQLIQRVKEIDFLLKILDTMPKYTAEQLEAEEPTYWRKRLARQAFLAPRDPGGNQDAMLQMITTPGLPKPEVPVGAGNVLSSMGIDDQAIITGLLNANLITKDEAAKALEVRSQKPIAKKKHKR